MDIWVTALLAAYWVAVLTARYFNIAGVSRSLLRSEIHKVEIRVAAMGSAGGSDKECAAALLAQAKETAQKASAERIRTFFYWTRGEEISAWIDLHEAEKFIANSYSLEQTVARLRVAVQELRPDYGKVADTVEAVLADPQSSPAYLKATLKQALDCVYEGVDNSSQTVFSWQNKAFTLLYIALCVLTVLIWTCHHSVFILMALAGGLVSRLLRGARGTEIPRDFGANWTTLFMSPIYGAFAGWFGLLMLVGLQELGVLGKSFDSLAWLEEPTKAAPLALAFLFGFSERMFTAVSDALEKAVTDKLKTSAADAPGEDSRAAGNRVVLAAPVPRLPEPAPVADPLSYAFPGKAWVVKGKNLGGVVKADFKEAPGSLAMTKAAADRLELMVAAGLPVDRQYVLLLNGSIEAGSATVPVWSVESAVWKDGKLTVTGASLSKMPALELRGGESAIPLTVSPQALDSVAIAGAATKVASGSYGLFAGGVDCGSVVEVAQD